MIIGTELASILPNENPNIALAPYFPTNATLESGMEFNTHGIGYRCSQIGGCASGFELRWYQESRTDCGIGESSPLGNLTLCDYAL